MTNKEEKKLFIREVRRRLDAYLAIVIRNLRDLIPKLIGQILVTKSMDSMQLEIIEGINKSTEVLDCLSEVSLQVIISQSIFGWREKQFKRLLMC